MAIDVEKIFVIFNAAFPRDVQIKFAEIWLIVFVVLNSPKSGKRREVADRVGNKSGDNMPVPLEQFFIRVKNYEASSLNTSWNCEKFLGGLSTKEIRCQAQIPTFS